MIVLAIDTASAVLSLSLGSASGVWRFEVDAGPKHSEYLMGGMDLLVKAAGLKPADVELAACMRGPGSFTGIRIGFAAAQGLALALGIPMTAVPTLDCMARPFTAWPGAVLPVIDAKQGRYFAALYREGGRISEYLDAEPGRLVSLLPPELPVLLTGPGAGMMEAELLRVLPRERVFVDPAHKRGRSAELLEMVQKNGILDKSFEPPVPLYLRKSDAELGPK